MALRHPEFGQPCKGLLDEVVKGTYVGYGSPLVAYEIFGSLSKVRSELAVGAVRAYYSMPIRIIDPERRTYEMADSIASLSGVTYDAVHAAIMMGAGVHSVATEDVDDWMRIRDAWTDVAGSYGLEIADLVIARPTKL